MRPFPEFNNEASYLEFLQEEAYLPAGFRAAATNISFTPQERPTLEPYRMNIGLILTDQATDVFGGMFTRNAFPGAPVILGRQQLDEPRMRGVVVNNKIANVRSATGIEDARRLTASLGGVLDLPAEELFISSTGIIGWALPVAEMEAALPELAANLHEGSALDVAQAIMTTDSFPKARRTTVGDGSIMAIAKGAGMIEPNMATMLVFVMTDCTITRDEARAALREAVAPTFNAITIDSDMSTSDTILLFSSCRTAPVHRSEFQEALTEVCRMLAQDVVRNGEGTGHVVQVTVRGMPDDTIAAGMAKAVVNSPLAKTAIFGNDPNVGRILVAIGDFLGSCGSTVDTGALVINLGTETVFRDGAFRIDREKETHLSDYLKTTALNPRLRGYPQHQRCAEILIECCSGAGKATVWGSDLSDQYVRENADYRT
jgi:glutamate N-acetyltransferase/amino-acid N-acetyltransferase